jgi:hypothetical protein
MVRLLEYEVVRIAYDIKGAGRDQAMLDVVEPHPEAIIKFIEWPQRTLLPGYITWVYPKD